MSNLKGKVALVTGASKGIGASIAKHLAQAGASVVVNYASSKDGADKVVAEITKAGGKAIAVKGDVGKSADITALLKETKKAYGKLDILVNNAGVFQFQPLAEATEAEYKRQFDTNVFGTLFVTKEALNYFPEEGGSVINLSSIVADNPVPASVIYSATKGAVDTITVALARELGPRKIRVNAVAPGGVETEGTHTLGMIGSDFEKQIVAGTPLGRLGQPEDIARAAVFLASSDSGWVTGQTVKVSGGHA